MAVAVVVVVVVKVKTNNCSLWINRCGIGNNTSSQWLVVWWFNIEYRGESAPPAPLCHCHTSEEIRSVDYYWIYLKGEGDLRGDSWISVSSSLAIRSHGHFNLSVWPSIFWWERSWAVLWWEKFYWSQWTVTMPHRINTSGKVNSVTTHVTSNRTSYRYSRIPMTLNFIHFRYMSDFNIPLEFIFCLAFIQITHFLAFLGFLCANSRGSIHDVHINLRSCLFFIPLLLIFCILFSLVLHLGSVIDYETSIRNSCSFHLQHVA